ncbi:ROK family transcriptional regulator [Streptomyces profundus]|uniref:ROK family transcriptional regulator n=1 Tax=Streptomyces profundus TaxID=2867410 RepID=UPI001D16DB5A|nr:ROK family transcriptional regulator [Streptomyces sp. MA3_2.13]UED82995.1 ROK family transcriptional regulator [Streptomyces sp. MA3_2.13]
MSTVRTATPRTARVINDRAVLELLAEHGPLTAPRLRELTGLSRPSVADLLGRLNREGLVTVVGEAGADRPGPNAKVYGLVPDRAHVAALDVRTDGVALALADLTGETVATATLPLDPPATPPGGEGAGHPMVETALATLARERRRAGVRELHTVVLGAPGLADPATGALRPSGGLPAWHRELLFALRRTLDVPVLLDNEVNLAGIAEHRLGAVQDVDTYVLLWLGAGVGAAVVLGGALRRGASGGAGEVGFLPVPGTGGVPSSADCDRGFHGLAASAAVRALAERHGLPAPDVPADDVAHVETLVRRAVAEDIGPAAGFLDELAGRIALGAASVTAVLDPGYLVLGGEVGRAGGEALARRVAERLRALSPLETEVRASTVTGSAVLGGGLLTALDAARADLFATDR